MSGHHHTQIIPRGVLLGAAAMILLSLALAAGARRAQLSRAPSPARPPIESLDVRFEDRPDGAIAVFDARASREISVVAPRTGGFIRGVLRGMFRTRKLESLGRGATFHLVREADGHLSLTDPETRRRVELDSFGPTNSAAFAQILAAGKAARQVAATGTR